MSASEDVKTLFRRFGGEAETYQEVVREDQAVKSLGRWAMLGQVDVGRTQSIPSARRAIKTSETRHSLETDELPVLVAPAFPLPAMTQPEAIPTARVATASVAAPADPVPSRTVMAPRPRANAPRLRANAPRPVAAAPAATQPARQSQTAMPSAPRATPKAAPGLAPAETPKRVSALAARLKPKATQQTVAPPPNAPTKDHSLPGLFSRLSGTSSPKLKPGPLQRKFNT